jgi:hypothetical protein
VSEQDSSIEPRAPVGVPLAPGESLPGASDTSSASPQPFASPPPPKGRARAPKIVALVAAILAAFVMREFLRETGETSGQGEHSSSGPLVGEIQTVEGQVLIRPPRGTRFEAAKPGPYQAESVIQTQAASAAVIEFRPGPTIRLLENSRLVAELDSSRDGAMQVTILAGEVSVLNPGTNPLFTLLHNGISVPFRDGEVPLRRTVPLIEVGPADDETTAATNDLEEKIEIEKETEAATAPTVDLETLNPSAVPGALPTATPNEDPRVKTLPAKEVGNGLIRSTLTNDDIRTQLRAQAGSFQKCYVTMVNRMSESGVSAGALPKGEVSVAFKILPIGKVEEARVKKSPFKDSTFDRCVTEALGRLRFRQFQGAAIPIGDFPITLE